MPPKTARRTRAMRRDAPPPTDDAPLNTGPAEENEGALVALTPDGLVGWAWRPTQPEPPLVVVIQADGIEVGRGRADRFDEAVLPASRQQGRPGFCIRLQQLPGGLYPLLLTLHDLSGRRLGAPFRVREIAELLPVTDAVAAEYEGSIDEIREGVVSGWARDAQRPDIPLTIELLEPGQIIDRVRADGFREDLRLAGKGAGYHGYRLTLPRHLLDGQGHTLRVRIAGSKFELPNSPIAFGPLPPDDPAVALNELRTEVRQLTERVNALSDPSSSLLGEIVRRLSERMAALAEVQREGIAREVDALRRLAFVPNRAPDT
jgi:hypothetical protein